MPAAKRTNILRPPRFATKHQARVRMTQPGSTSARSAMVTPKNVSTSGICVLYRGYVHPGANCEVELITLYGSWLQVTGKVVRCRYVEDGMHEIGIKFDHEIDVTLICPDATERKVVVATSDDFLWELTSAWLRQGNSNQSRAVNEEELSSALENAVDLLLIDEVFGEAGGPEIARTTRCNGYFGYMVGLHGASRGETKQSYYDSGADEACEKPLSRESVERLLEASRVEPTVSSLSSDPGSRDVLERCITMLNALVFDAAEALRVEKVDDLLDVANRIGTVAGACGFEEIHHLAADVEGRCAEKTVELASAEFARLARLISAASV